jgi:WD40-like Beta Propeller Repeat
MTLAPPPTARPRPDDLEALIREARARQRRRRRRLAGVVLAAAGAAGLAYGLVRVTTPGTGVVRVAGGPTVNVRAFSHHGRLAFVSRGVLWVLDGERGKLRRIRSPHGATPVHPVFSADGRWLAFLAQRHDAATNSDSSRLWIARADGSGARAVGGFTALGLYGWSPAADLVAVTAGPVQKERCPCYSPTTLRLVSPDGSSRVLARGPWIYSAAWSPGGRQIALGIEQDPAVGHPSLIVSYPADGGEPTTWLRLKPQQRFGGMTGVLLHPAGWWRGFGIGFWIDGDGATRNLDATPLYVVAAPGKRPRRLGQTLSDGTTITSAASTVGARLALVADVGHGVNGGRVFWDRKQVQLCAPTRGCRGLVDRPSKVTVDPAWSPDGETLALIEAPDYQSIGWGQHALVRWYTRHRLLLYDASTEVVRSVPAASGAAVPLWSAAGRSLLYVAGDGLWLLPTLNGKPTRIAAPLFPAHDWPSYFGQIAWSIQFAWSSA